MARHMSTLYVTLIGRALGIECNAGPYCPWCTRADTATNRQLERHAYPGQASQRAVRVPPRCTCWYGVPLEYAFTVFATPRFTIRRSCPHHGDAALTDG